MKTPHLSYCIWFVQRSGSTLLYKGLESTGIAGKPGEHFNAMGETSLFKHHGVDTYEDFKKNLWQLGGTDNGVFGIKYPLHQAHHQKLMNEFKAHQSFDKSAMSEEEIWEDLFPNCKHIFLTRRNKFRLAVSWWKGILDEEWHLEKGGKRKQASNFYEGRYDFAALSHLLHESILKEAATQEYFSRRKIAPLTLIYEDYIQNYEASIQTIIDYLEIEYNPPLQIAPKFYEITADAHSEEWVQRFRAEFQKNMEEKPW